MTKKFDKIGYIGRFQIPHNAHMATIRRMAELSDTLVIFIGSSFKPRTFKNPFTFEERKLMLSEAIKEMNLAPSVQVHFKPIRDRIYDDTAWVVSIQEAMSSVESGPNVALIGHEKDESTYYLSMFPNWTMVEQPLVEVLDASTIRDLYFKENVNLNLFRSAIFPSTAAYLGAFKTSEAFKEILVERTFIQKYKQQFASLPYPPIFVTADAVVVQSGHILLVKRAAAPGRGLWALPGGFVDANTDRSIKSAAIRELIEETGIKLPLKVLEAAIHEEKVFDAIGRSDRGRTITQAFYFRLNDGEWNLPKLRAQQSEVTKAEWVPLNEVRSEELFDDHYDIISYFVSL